MNKLNENKLIFKEIKNKVIESIMCELRMKHERTENEPIM